ncbi:LPD7 domain-containing protein, partial [Gilliamella sp. BG1]
MIVRFGGGNNGIAEYLEKGIKQGRTLSRDELDKRVILEGDLALTDRIINSIENKGQERYLHISLSFREDDISNDTLQDIVKDYRELLMSAYSDDEFNFYAEAHLPKIKRIKDERTGKMIVRKPHIHIVIPEVNLLTLNKLSPVGLVDKNTRYLDSIQEFINYKYNLATPKDYVRNADMHYANVLSRIKGDFFGEKQHNFKNLLVDEIASGKINTISEFQARLANFGDIKVRNKGKNNQYFAVKIEGDKKFTNLNHPVFKESFIKNKILPYNKPDIEQINADLLEWKHRVSREIKHVHFATQSFRKLYATADPEKKAQLLIDREAKYDQKYRKGRYLHKNRRKRDYKSNLTYAKKRQSRATSRKASSVSSLSYSDMVYRKNQRSRNVESFLSEDEHAYLRNRKSSDNFKLRRTVSKRTRVNRRRIKRKISYRSFSQINRGLPSKKYSKNVFDKDIEKRSFNTEFERFQATEQNKGKNVSKFGESNTLSFMAKSHQSEQEKKAELNKFAEIRKNIDPDLFLKHLEKVYAIDPKKHVVTYAKDGSPRFRVEKLNLNASDFLTKYLNIEWKEAKLVLSYIYDNQESIKQQNIDIDIQKNISQFTFEVRQFEKNIKFVLHNLNVDNRNLYRGEKKRIYSRFSEPKIRNQELAIASFRAMQRQERINQIETMATYRVEFEKSLFQQSGYTNNALEDSNMAFKESLNIALGNEFGRISSAEEKINFSDNFRQQQTIVQRHLQEQQKQTNKSKDKEYGLTFTSKALEEVMKLNNLGIAKKKNGDIEYKRLADGKTVCTDVGNQMLISKDMQTPENIKTFLELAIDKYGNELKINGSKEFKEKVIESVAVHNLPIILKPATLQEQLMNRRRELQFEEKLESLDSITNEFEQQINRSHLTQESPEVEKSTQKASEAEKPSQESPEVEKSTQKAPEAEKPSQESPEVEKSTQKAPEAEKP